MSYCKALILRDIFFYSVHHNIHLLSGENFHTMRRGTKTVRQQFYLYFMDEGVEVSVVCMSTVA